MQKYNWGVFLFRAQPIHNSHLAIIKKALNENENVLLVIGSSDKRNEKRNPLDIHYRLHLVHKVLIDELSDYDYERIKIATLRDLSTEDALEDDVAWGHYLYYNIVNQIGNRRFKLYYSDSPEIMIRWFDNEVKNYIDIAFIDRSTLVNGLSATKIRELIKENTYESLSQLKGMLPRAVSNEIGYIYKCLRDAEDVSAGAE